VLGQSHISNHVNVTSVHDERYIYRRRSRRTVSIVYSLFHWARQGSLVGSTWHAISWAHATISSYAYLAIPLIDTRQVDLRSEGYLGWLFRVFVTTEDLETVDAVLVDALRTGSVMPRFRAEETYVWRPKDRAIPVVQILIIVSLHALCGTV
jgi:hypothetical protein